MANYIVPQVLINQLISEVPLNTVKNQNVLVVGPNYELFRFAEEKDKTYIGEYVNKTGQEGGGGVYVDAAGEKEVETSENIGLNKDNLRKYGVIPYPGQAAATIPDAGYSRLFADEVTIKLFSLGNFYFLDDVGTIGLDARFRFPYVISGPKSVLGMPTQLWKICDATIDDDGKCVDGRCGSGEDGSYHWEISVIEPTDGNPQRALARSLNPGDVVRIPYKDSGGEDKVYRSTIISVFESVEGTGIFDSVQLADALPDEFTTFTEESPLSNDYVDYKEVLADEGKDHSVAYVVQYFDAYDDDTIGPAGDDDSNDECDDSSDYSSESGKDFPKTVQLCAQFSDVEIPRKTNARHVWNWDAYAYDEIGAESTYGVVVTGNLRVKYSNWLPSDAETAESPEYRVLTAKLYAQHRDLITATASDISSVSSYTLVETTLGTVHPDNPLAFGVYMAALNSGDRLVYFCGVPTDDLSGYNKVLEKATLTDDVYIICPTTMDLSVAQSVKAHVLEMSTAQNKLWRIGFVSVEPPKTDSLYDSSNNPSGEPFYARLTSVGKNPGGMNAVQLMRSGSTSDQTPNSDVRFLNDVQAGDVVKIWLDNSEDDWDDTPHYTERYIVKVLTNNAVQLGSPIKVCPDDQGRCLPDYLPEGKENGRFKVELYRQLTATQQVKYIAAQSSQLATRRMYNVFPSVASNDGVSFDGSFLACAAAGLASSVLPQQPLTNVAINGVSDIPVVYQTYSKAQLDEIAAGGTFIIMQDRPNSQVYVRHQISTDYTSGNLLKAELSVTKNLDSISYYFAELFAPYIGKYNITPELITILDNVLGGGLDALETDTAAGLYGPQVIAEGTEVLYVRQSAVNRDHVEARVHLNLPVPFNYFDLDLEI